MPSDTRQPSACHLFLFLLSCCRAASCELRAACCNPLWRRRAVRITRSHTTFPFTHRSRATPDPNRSAFGPARSRPLASRHPGESAPLPLKTFALLVPSVFRATQGRPPFARLSCSESGRLHHQPSQTGLGFQYYTYHLNRSHEHEHFTRDGRPYANGNRRRKQPRSSLERRYCNVMRMVPTMTQA